MSGILIVAEQRRGELRTHSFELVTAAQGLRRGGEEVSVAVIGAAPDRYIAELCLAGVDEKSAGRVSISQLLKRCRNVQTQSDGTRTICKDPDSLLRSFEVP